MGKRTPGVKGAGRGWHESGGKRMIYMPNHLTRDFLFCKSEAMAHNCLQLNTKALLTVHHNMNLPDGEKLICF